MQAFAAHATIGRKRKKHSHGRCREFPPPLAGWPGSRAAPGRPPRERPAMTGYRLAGPPAERLDDELTLPPAPIRVGQKGQVRHSVFPAPAGLPDINACQGQDADNSDRRVTFRALYTRKCMARTDWTGASRRQNNLQTHAIVNKATHVTTCA
jgi:hypothetical protein